MEASKRGRKDTRTSDVKEKDTVLDAGLWGKLQEHIKLQNVYEKLPHEELFRLRLVCKAWNHAALRRLEPKPYFVTVAGKAVEQNQYLDGVLSYDITSQKFNFKRLRFPLNHPLSGDEPFEVEGLILCHYPKNMKQQGVFNIHNRTWHPIPRAPEKSKQKSAIGMMVDTSERPYTFKLVVGSLDKKTQIYDSKTRSWSTTSSKVVQLAKSALNSQEPVTCMCSNGCVFISIGAQILLMYSMEGDTWTILDFPEVKQEEDGGGAVHALGEWDGRIFTTREDCDERNVTVWELVDRTKQEWVEYAVMSEEEYDTLMECDFTNNGPSIYEEMRLLPCFCDGYLLVYNWQYLNGVAEALAMLNLATKKWKQVDLPPGTVAIKEGSEDEEEEGSEDEDEEDEEEKGEGSDDEDGEDEGGNGEGSDDEEEDDERGNGEGSDYEDEADEEGNGEGSEDEEDEE